MYIVINSDGKVVSMCSNSFESDTFEVLEKEVNTEQQEAFNKGFLFLNESGELVVDEPELFTIEEGLKAALPRYNELKELWDLRSNSEEEEFQTMEAKKKVLLTRRKEILDNEI